MDTKTLTEEEIQEEIFELTKLLSVQELQAIGLSLEEINHPTEEVLKKIQAYFQKITNEN